MNETITIIVLGLICIGQLIERALYAKDMSNKLNDAVKAVMSRNISEYLAATTQPKQTPEPVAKSEDIDLSDADDDVFDKAIRKM